MKLEKPQKQVLKIKSKDMQMLMSMHLQEELYLLPFLISMISK